MNSFLTLDVVVEESWRRNTQDVHLNQFHSLPLLIKLSAKKALLAATPGHQPDRLIMFAAF